MEGPVAEVKLSTIPGAGNGLFARHAIDADGWIATYGGEMKRIADGAALPNGDYVYMFPEGLVAGRLTELQIIASGWRNTYRDPETIYDPKDLGRWINHNPASANAFADIDGKDPKDGSWVLSFYARRRIEAGEEIFINYGPNYRF